MSGVTFTVKTLINDKYITETIEKECKGVQAQLDAVILADSNYFCPLKTGTLQKSAIINSRLGSGELVWKTPYARRHITNTVNHRTSQTRTLAGAGLRQQKRGGLKNG